MDIVQLDDGTEFDLTIDDDIGSVDLNGATVDVVIVAKYKRISKTATITGAKTCTITLESTDVDKEGYYNFQATVMFPDNKVFSSEIKSFRVSKKL